MVKVIQLKKNIYLKFLLTQVEFISILTQWWLFYGQIREK